MWYIMEERLAWHRPFVSKLGDVGEVGSGYGVCRMGGIRAKSCGPSGYPIPNSLLARSTVANAKLVL